jgi:hypothetical protein
MKLRWQLQACTRKPESPSDEHYYIVFLGDKDDYFIVSSRRESGSQQLTSTFSKEFVEEVRNVIFYCIPWRTNGSRKTITFLL